LATTTTISVAITGSPEASIALATPTRAATAGLSCRYLPLRRPCFASGSGGKRPA
jgi:hypothetical protein